MTRVVSVTTPKLGMVRLHGRNAATWYKRVEKTGHRFDYLYPPSEIEEIAANVRLLAELSASVHVAVNTNNNSQGPINALALAEALQFPYRNPDLLAELRTAVDLPLDRLAPAAPHTSAAEGLEPPTRGLRIRERPPSCCYPVPFRSSE
jgi:hypothetical protein